MPAIPASSAVSQPRRQLSAVGYVRGTTAALIFAPSTWKRYGLDIDRHITQTLGNLRLDKVTPLAVENLYRNLQKEGLSANTVRHTHAVLRASYREAFRLGIVVVNVMDRVRAPKAVRPEIHHMSLDQAKVVLDQARGRGTRAYARWALALRWGPRQGEVLGLRWSDVDLETGRIQIRQALQRRTGAGLVMTAPKSLAGRREFHVDPDTICAALSAWRRDQLVLQVAAHCWGGSDLVFTTDSGTPVDPRNDYRGGATFLRTRVFLGSEYTTAVTRRQRTSFRGAFRSAS